MLSKEVNKTVIPITELKLELKMNECTIFTHDLQKNVIDLEKVQKHLTVLIE